MVTTEGYMFFPPLVGSDGETQKLKKLNHHSFFGNPFYHWLSGHCNKFLVLFAQDLIVNCLTPLACFTNYAKVTFNAQFWHTIGKIIYLFKGVPVFAHSS